MGKIIDFTSYLAEEPDLDSMDQAQLQAYLEKLRSKIAELDESEPHSMGSEAHEEWGQCHEDLEDLVDDVMDRLEEWK